LLPAANHQPTGSAPKSRTFDALYQAHASQVMRWASRLGGPQIDAEDVTQEVFLVVHRRLQTLRPDVKPTTWIFAITANVVRAHRRRYYLLRLMRKIDRHDFLSLATPVPTPLETVQQRRAGAIVYDILNRMTETHRRVFVLFELEGMSIDEIAELMEATPVATRVRLHRARGDFFRRLSCFIKREGLT
jgi:RNA polymerase sigma-70 factor (ECF subfamily)